MVLIPVRGPYCDSNQIVKRGKTENAKQRYLCQQQACPVKTFILDYDYNGCLLEVKQQLIERALNRSGIRDTARVLEISPPTVINELKKRASSLESVNSALLESLDPSKVIVKIQRVEEAELDEMWSYVGSKDNPRWLGHAIDHESGKVLA